MYGGPLWWNGSEADGQTDRRDAERGKEALEERGSHSGGCMHARRMASKRRAECAHARDSRGLTAHCTAATWSSTSKEPSRPRIAPCQNKEHVVMAGLQEAHQAATHAHAHQAPPHAYAHQGLGAFSQGRQLTSKSNPRRSDPRLSHLSTRYPYEGSRGRMGGVGWGGRMVR